MKEMNDPMRARARRLQALSRAGALALLLATSGCPITPKFVKPEVRLNAAWSDARLAKTAIDVAWWRAFKDPALDREGVADSQPPLSCPALARQLVPVRPYQWTSARAD